jgi:DNA-binding response OmpR family regulator
MNAPTVLLVEDEPEIVGLLTDFLAVEGFGVIAAPDAPRAIAAMDRRGVDCVLLDVMLPGASGFDLCRRIRERSDVPVLFLSARGEVDLPAHEVRLSGRPVSLTAREFELLALFAAHPRQVLTREQIFERVWGSWGDRSAVAVYVRRLREKLGDDLLTTVWGVGYRFDPPRP